MTLNEYNKYIEYKFRSELNEEWFVEIRNFFDEPYLYITNGYWSFSTGIIKDLYEGNIDVETTYLGIKKLLEQDYLKQLWR